jgi:hypothetical protein
MITEETSYQDIVTSPIKTYADLQLNIAQLKVSKQLQEVALKKEIAELVDSLNLATIIKDSIYKLAVDKEVQFDIAKVGLNYGADFVINQLIGRKAGLPVFLLTKLVQSATGGLIKKYASNIFTSLLNRFVPRIKQNTLNPDIYLIETEKTDGEVYNLLHTQESSQKD